MNATHVVTRQFLTGMLAGIVFAEATTVPMKVGRIYGSPTGGSYTILSCVEAAANTPVRTLTPDEVRHLLATQDPRHLLQEVHR